MDQMLERVEKSVENSMIYLVNSMKIKKSYSINPTIRRQATDRSNVQDILFAFQNSPLQ
jgi:hypothetical protein